MNHNRIKLSFGREICGNLALAEQREWLVTNGIGGFAAGTVAGLLTRRYHGLLLAALQPPLGRTLLLTKLDETVTYGDAQYPLFTNRWADGTVAPHGYLHLESFALDGTIPVWLYGCADGLLEKRLWMKPGKNTTYICYSYIRGSQPLSLSLKALVNNRDYHHSTRVENKNKSCGVIELIKDRQLAIKTFVDTPSLYLSAIASNPESNFTWSLTNTWYRNFALAVENYRGLDAIEDHWLPCRGNCVLQPGDSLTIVASTEKDGETGRQTEEATKKKEQELIELFYTQNQLKTAPAWIEQLVLAADQFIVPRPLKNHPQGKTIIAGYPWFGDWGRDTMIALPGLTLTTGRFEVARVILRTFAQYIDGGMLPNLFPDVGETPGYNTVDATLWYFEAIRDYYAHTQDQELLIELYPALAEIIDWHRRGTRYNIYLDDDGLIYAGEKGIQLTWMDAKVGDWVVTPRIGKPVEVNALWYNALVIMTQLAQALGKSGQEYHQMATRTKKGFQRFWHRDLNYCYDVLDSPEGNDLSLRPNQIFAVSLPVKVQGANPSPLLDDQQQKQVVEVVAQHLLTSYGLRSLAPQESDYIPIYGGTPLQRDGGYHQGTVWSWLMGHFLQAHLQVYQNPELARSFVLPMAHHLEDACVGNISEIFDGDLPFIPRGAFAQAWSVAEVLRGWRMTRTASNS